MAYKPTVITIGVSSISCSHTQTASKDARPSLYYCYTNASGVCMIKIASIFSGTHFKEFGNQLDQHISELPKFCTGASVTSHHSRCTRAVSPMNLRPAVDHCVYLYNTWTTHHHDESPALRQSLSHSRHVKPHNSISHMQTASSTLLGIYTWTIKND